MVVSNCLNCGAALDITGHCNYCGTDNVIDREISMDGELVELLLVQKSQNTCHYLPVVGRISSLTVRHDYCDITIPSHLGLMVSGLRGSANVSFEFDGYVSETRSKTQ